MTKQIQKLLKSYKLPIFKCIGCNCEVPWSRMYKIYCSNLCRDEAHFIRYARRCTLDGRINRPDIQEALKIKLIFLISGGYKHEERRISDKIREKVLKRDKYKCKVCGKNATDIHHIDGVLFVGIILINLLYCCLLVIPIG